MEAEKYKPDPKFDRLSQRGGAPFYDPVRAAEFPTHRVRYRNDRWAGEVGLSDLSEDAWIKHFGAFEPLPGNLQQPLALRYHGHQFRSYNPDIGDGRGFLFAQLRDRSDRLLDLGTKGSGQTPYSRFGDGRLTLKGGVRELLATEMLEALGVYTSKTFSLIETGEALERQDEPSPTRSAVLVRLSHSHVRFGAFQRLAFEKDADAIRELVAYCVEHFYPGIAERDDDARAAAFFAAVTAQTARLTAQWIAAGFVHGVLNTDNMNVTGESFDYGPWRFAPTADPEFTAAYFDQTGLYAFGRQGEAGAWNLAQLGGALSLVASEDALNDVLRGYPELYHRALAEAVFARLGIQCEDAEAASAFVSSLLGWMTETDALFEQVFFDWFGGRSSEQRASKSPIADYYQSAAFSKIRDQLCDFTPADEERLGDAYFQQDRPCTMLIDEVEDIWSAIAEEDDWTPLSRKLNSIEGMRQAYRFDASRFDA